MSEKMSKRECTCTMAQRLTGDGCSVCNPAYALEMAEETIKDLESGVEELKGLKEIQGQDGNWNHDHYMRGLYNGIELALSLFEKRSPVYKDSPKDNPIDSEWQELKIDDLPRDILTPEIYTFQHKLNDGTWCCVSFHTPGSYDFYVLKELRAGVTTRYRPRQPEKKQPERLTKRIAKMCREEGKLFWSNSDGSFQILSEGESAKKVVNEVIDPIHEDIMTLWWKNGDLWFKVVHYNKGEYICITYGSETGLLSDIDSVPRFCSMSKSEFTGLKSATIPTESND